MISLEKNNKVFEDVSYGRYGINILRFIARFILFILFESWAIFAIFTETPEWTIGYIAIVFCFFACPLYLMYLGASIKYAYRTVQYLSFSKEEIYFRFYFWRRIYCKIHEIESISEFLPNDVMRMSELFGNGAGLIVNLTNKKTFRISAKIKKFEQIRQLLEERLQTV